MAVIAKPVASVSAHGAPPRYVIVPLAALVAVLVFALAANVVFAERALPRTTIAGVDVGTLSPSEIRDRLDHEIARPWAAARVAVAGPDDRTWTTTNGALAISPDVDRAVSEALAFGHTGPVTQRLAAWIDALRGGATVPFAMRSEGRAADAWVSSVARDIDRAPIEGAVAVTYDGIVITQAVVGRETDRAALRTALLAPDTLGDRALTAAVHETYPAVDPSGIRDAAAKARAVTTSLEVRAGDGVVHEDAAGLATLLVIERVPAAPGELDAIPAGATVPSTRYVYHATLDAARVASWVANVAKTLDHPAKNASYLVRPDGSLAVVPAADGVKIDQSRLTTDVLAQLVGSAAAPRSFAPTVVVDKPIFTTDQAQQFVGRMALVSSFTTTYPPSPSRHANITTGAAQFNDVVIAPGESFSFWDRLGEVTVERGYAYAGAIINNRSDENVIGGGLCQVSTSLFNAVARAGYQIDERHEHGYYIDRYPLGFDAAVFEPGVDMRWTNDTAYPVLIKAYGFLTAVRFDLISVPTGRRVVLGDPIQSNLKDPAPDQPADPAYPPGAVVQGRDVSRIWTVYAGDTIVHQETFRSHYVPVWGGPAR